MLYSAGSFDVAVIGAGHAGIEASLASARLGCKTAVFTMNLDLVGNCPCNPSIGGIAKGHLVREIDALGGEMGKTTDQSLLQSRMLNKGKGPAVHSLRAQIDRRKYSEIMKFKLERQKNLFLLQAEIVTIRLLKHSIWLIISKTGAVFKSKTIILATGTYLKSKIHIGTLSFNSGPDGTSPSIPLSNSLDKLGIIKKRFKTGTPARILKSSIDFSKLQKQEGDVNITPFSYDTNYLLQNKAACYVGWTNLKTKNIILDNIKTSAMYSGNITGTGPRYCPSIEDKIIRFSDKQKHQFFVEPCGANTDEMYIQGMSSSLPEKVQWDLYRSIDGFENSIIMRPAYAIEYDCIDPLQLNSSLEFINLPGLFGAGQFNGSSGYEEAAAQGLIAGINAALKVNKKAPFILDRASSYIGTLIDDLVTKGVQDPYRMLTSRSEYRLVLRQDNADQRLTQLGRKIGLINDNRWNLFLEKQQIKNKEYKRLSSTVIHPSKSINDILVSRETSPISTAVRLIDLMKRSQISYKSLENIDSSRPPELTQDIMEQIEIEIKYHGYIKKQLSKIREMRKLENKIIPKNIDYYQIHGISLEAREKLAKVRPVNIGQASRISGVNPSDINVLILFLSKF